MVASMKAKCFSFAFLALGLMSCGSDQDDASSSAATSGLLTVSCTVSLSEVGQTTCSERREVSQAVADALVSVCVSDEDPDMMKATETECLNKSAALGECAITKEGEGTVYLYQSGDGVTVAIAENACKESDGVFTAK